MRGNSKASCASSGSREKKTARKIGNKNPSEFKIYQQINNLELRKSGRDQGSNSAARQPSFSYNQLIGFS